jgi:glutamate N-acetyltransferase/amino-acid N-acetyltransferase
MKISGCPGYRLAGIASGIKKNKKRDLGLIFSEVPTSVAGVFTRNKIQAAPVLLDRQRIQSGVCRGLIVNSGNANCCTGERGMQDAIKMARLAAAGLGISEDLLLVASTGVIGEPLPMEKIEAAMSGLVKALHPEGLADFVEAIMTTDTVPKIVTRQGELDRKQFTIIGAAKGAGMIRPDMATLLCFVMTDVKASPARLKAMLKTATDRSFNRITIDGDTSTNDTAILMANGLSAAAVNDDSRAAVFQSLLDEVLMTLAKQLVQDGEGATKLVEIRVKGALSDHDARQIADTVANSNLLKTAFYGQDANWGRILAAVGRAGVPVEPDTIDVYFDSGQMVKNGMGCGQYAEAQAAEVLKKPDFVVTIDLNMGSGTSSAFTCDFSIDYVKINADYRS